MNFLKKTVKWFFYQLGLILSIKPILFAVKFLRWSFAAIYSGWIRSQIKQVKGDFSVKFPLYLIGGKNICIGEHFIAGRRFRIETYDKYANTKFHPIINIGNNVTFNDDCHIGCINSVSIGDNVLFASKIYITDHFHGNTNGNQFEVAPSARELFSKGTVIIENNVLIGEGVCIMPNVHIGKNSVIGANSVITKSFPENSVIAGNPAKLIKGVSSEK